MFSIAWKCPHVNIPSCLQVLLFNWAANLSPPTHPDWTIGHFRIPKTLTSKMRLSANPFLWKWVLFAWEQKSHFHINSFALSHAMKKRLGVTRKWPIRAVVYYLVLRNFTAPITRKFHLVLLAIIVIFLPNLLMMSLALELFLYHWHTSLEVFTSANNSIPFISFLATAYIRAFCVCA